MPPDTGNVIRIGMWSGPRNLSTALMRSWESRQDTIVHDEPFYASFLHRTGIDHPMRRETLAEGVVDPALVIADLLRDLPRGTIYYQKQMAHHLPPGLDLDWILQLRNCLLIRDPRQMLGSLLKETPAAGLEDTGLPQQHMLIDFLLDRLQEPPPIVDARDILEDPEGMMRAICSRLGVCYDPGQLSWKAGTRDPDGPWAAHWYGSVTASTGFAPYVRKDVHIPEDKQPLLQECIGLYEPLHRQRLRPEAGKPDQV